jgi:response regulator RpfG family c-di-GMP phosphodiesterase
MNTTYVPNKRILYADDEASLLNAFRALMRKEPFDVMLLQDSRRIDETLASSGPFALVISDQRMPGVDGVELLTRVSRVHPETSRVLLTGYASHEDTARAVNLGGIAYYVQKPWDDQDLVRLVHDQVARYNLSMENRLLFAELEESNHSLATLLDGTVASIVRLLGDMVGMASREAAASGERIRKVGRAFLQLLPDIDEAERRDILLALELHQFGLAVLPAWIQVSLQKSGLSSLERLPNARNHNQLAAALLKTVPNFEHVAAIIRLQNKNIDGSGEPVQENVGGEALPLGSRLLHILIEFDRMSTATFKGKDVLQHMMRSPSKYDVDLIQIMLGGVAVRRGAGKEAALALGALEPGMVVLADVVTEGGQFLLRTDAVLSETSIAILMQWHATDPIVQPIHVRIPS